MTRPLAILLLLSLAACQDDGAVADNVGDIPPTTVTQVQSGDWSGLEPAVGRTPADSGMLSKGPIVTDLHALVGADAIDFRERLERTGGRLTRVGRLLVTASPPGEQASYLIVDSEQLALEAGYKKDGRWVVQRTPGTEIERPAAIEALLAG